MASFEESVDNDVESKLVNMMTKKEYTRLWIMNCWGFVVKSILLAKPGLSGNKEIYQKPGESTSWLVT